jgi:hypothetical protein
MEIISVRLGEWNLETEKDCKPDDPTACAPKPIDIKVDEVITHASYHKSSAKSLHDIALLRLAEPVEFNDFVKPICLPLDPELWTKDYTGYTFEAAGFGKQFKVSI